jgi:hypothetical protein
MALAALVSSLALLAAQPAFLLAQAETQPAPAGPVSTGEDPSTAAQADAMAKGEAPFPAGAPTDDYGLVGWCYGALTGHMGLYKTVMPEVERIERAFPDPAVPIEEALKGYTEQHALGAKDLDMFKSALDAADKGDPKAHAAARKASIELGLGSWKGADTANRRTLAQLWMSWELPARCEPTAQRLIAASSGEAQ